ncbi:GMP synthase [glutamine-hydrolyzing] [Candidatus Cyrtobacter comes]|uniref:GMP synthase [glutamine-hydrolyzing] n=1 Tax=Candidatus Cyrtobacter comes TaxID=675776 RepID=A0ABU5L6J8_9RICK|nr:glutamine-hydrolyzing GMP synthase [Candidatus Cyrtobacter comes]MDZ5761751.1 GMP synthase [glutamine-hydrolyzing] [Candidatus Cyrtobacter comes]
MTTDKVLILDFGSQLTQLIAKRIRGAGVYSQIMPCSSTEEEIRNFKPKAIILSGSPSSVYEEGAPSIPDIVFSLNIPVLGICYGQQAMCNAFGGEIRAGTKKEFGKTSIKIIKNSPIFEDIWSIGNSYDVWMSHGDCITNLPHCFEVLAVSDNSPFAIIADKKRKLYGVQFHPEVVHTPQGDLFISNFVTKVAQCRPEWKMNTFMEEEISYIQKKVGNEKVICAISGGVDSSVVAALMSRAIGKNLYCIFVDNGLLRKNEAVEVENTLSSNFDFKLIHVNASKIFLDALKGVVDPEEKRKIIGKVFIETFNSEIKKIGDVKYLAQGTIYPDIIESVSISGGKAVTIKSHHNVGGLPENMHGLTLIEPLKFLFKDEVRILAKELGIPNSIYERHPFPGPGLAIRIIGDVNEEKCNLLREADFIFIEELKNSGLYNDVWQAYAALLPVKSVGVMGDARTYQSTCVLRAVTSSDGMSADYAQLPHEFLGRVARRIVNEVNGINRVFYDITSKPPATIELE